MYCELRQRWLFHWMLLLLLRISYATYKLNKYIENKPNADYRYYKEQIADLKWLTTEEYLKKWQSVALLSSKASKASKSGETTPSLSNSYSA